MEYDVIIIGAGASGLMAAKELSRGGKKVLILEARDRIGGRIIPLNEKTYGYTAQGGAEFVHGPAPVTKALLAEAGLHYVPSIDEVWSCRSGLLTKDEKFLEENQLLNEKLQQVTENISAYDFLIKHFPGDEHESLRNSICKIIEGYDAADPKDVSILTLKEEWLGSGVIEDGRVVEGYGAVLEYLHNTCKSQGVQILLSRIVQKVSYTKGNVEVTVKDGTIYKGGKVIVTVPLPLLKEISFLPPIPEKIEAASRIGFGHVIKVLLRFKNRWWENALGQDLTKMSFMLCNETFRTWWTQYPVKTETLVGWMAGPIALKYKETSNDELISEALDSLAVVFKTDVKVLRENLIHSEVFNWSKDPFSQGAYSYSSMSSESAYGTVAKPIENSVFFAGEALYNGKETATVEGAFASGKGVAERILKIYG